MRIFITGASGTVGRHIVLDRLQRGDHVVALTRNRQRLVERMATLRGEGPGELEIVEGDPSVPGTWQSSVDGCDSVVHLAGAGLMDRRWTSAYRSILRGSRVDSTYQIVRAIEQSARRPRVLLNASAVGFYGDRDDRQLVESDEVGTGFLAHLCAEWEAQALRAEPTCRVVCMRFGMILDRYEGALPRLLRVFRLGLGGRLGHGRQYISWIALPDVVAMIDLFLSRGDLRGPVNVVSPEPLSNRAFTAALAASLHRPAMLPVPRWVLKLGLGKAAEVVLTSQRVLPGVVSGTNFQWKSATITRAFRTILHGGAEASPTVKPGILLIDIDAISPGAPPLRRLLRKVDESGVRVVLVTSMGPEGAREFLAQSRMNCPVIAADGAIVVQRDAEAVLHRSELSPDIQDGILKAISACGPGIEVTLEDLRSARRVSTNPESTQPIKDCIRMRISAAHPVIESVLQAIGPGWWQPGKVLVHRDRPGRVDILSAKAERSVAAQWLARRWRVERDEVRAVLQGVRSCGLAQWCGQSIALATADDRLQQLCDRTASTAGIDGVAEAVGDFL